MTVFSHFRYSIVLNGITDIFGNTEIPKIPKTATFSDKGFKQKLEKKIPKKKF